MGLFSFFRKSDKKDDKKSSKSKSSPKKNSASSKQTPAAPKKQTPSTPKIGGRPVIPYSKFRKICEENGIWPMTIGNVEIASTSGNLSLNEMSTSNGQTKVSISGKSFTYSDDDEVVGILIDNGKTSIAVTDSHYNSLKKSSSGGTSSNGASGRNGQSGRVDNNGNSYGQDGEDGEDSEDVGPSKRKSSKSTIEPIPANGVKTIIIQSSSSDIEVVGVATAVHISIESDVEPIISNTLGTVSIQVPSRCRCLKVGIPAYYAGTLQIETSSGDINVENASAGSLIMSSSSGDVDASFKSNKASITTSSGDVNVIHLGDRVAMVNVTTSSGDVDYELRGVRIVDIEKLTSRGEVENHFKADSSGCSATVSIESSTGSVCLK